MVIELLIGAVENPFSIYFNYSHFIDLTKNSYELSFLQAIYPILSDMTWFMYLCELKEE